MINNKGKEHVEFVKKKKKEHFPSHRHRMKFPSVQQQQLEKNGRLLLSLSPFFLEWWMTLSIKRSTSTIIILQWERKPQNPAQEKKKKK